MSGTPGYMAPEQWAGRVVDARVDVFALGVIIHELVTGERLFQGETVTAICAATRAGVTQLGGERWQRAHASLRAHTARMLARDPDQRFADGADVLRALAELDESQSWRSIQVPTARPVAQPVGHTGSRRGARREAAGTVMAAVGLGAVAAVAVEQAREHGPAVDSSLCERCPEAEMASAWSPAQRASLNGERDQVAGFIEHGFIARLLTPPRWPVGPRLDVIVRGGAQITPWIYVLRGHPTARTTADLDRLVDGAADAMVMPAFEISAGNPTAEGLRYYQPGDRHRVTLGNSRAKSRCAWPTPSRPLRRIARRSRSPGSHPSFARATGSIRPFR